MGVIEMYGYKFLKDELCTARNVDLGGFLIEIDSERFYTDDDGYVRDQRDKKFKVDRVQNRYYMNSGGEYSSGNAIDYFAHIIGLGFIKAVEVLLAYVNSKKNRGEVNDVW